PARRILAEQTCAAGNVRAQVRRHSAYFEHFGKKRVWLGIGLRRRKGGHSRIDTCDGCRSFAQGRARECHLPRAGHGDRHVQGIGEYAGEKTRRHSRRTTETLSGFAVAGTRPNRFGDCPGRSISLLGLVQRHRRPISQRGWRRRFFLSSTPQRRSFLKTAPPFITNFTRSSSVRSQNQEAEKRPAALSGRLAWTFHSQRGLTLRRL